MWFGDKRAWKCAVDALTCIFKHLKTSLQVFPPAKQKGKSLCLSQTEGKKRRWLFLQWRRKGNVSACGYLSRILMQPVASYTTPNLHIGASKQPDCAAGQSGEEENCSYSRQKGSFLWWDVHIFLVTVCILKSVVQVKDHSHAMHRIVMWELDFYNSMLMYTIMRFLVSFFVLLFCNLKAKAVT